MGWKGNQGNPAQRAELRMRCLEAAMTMRTPGTSAQSACAIAQEFFDWVSEARSASEDGSSK